MRSIFKTEAKGYFSDLPDDLKEMVTELLQDTLDHETRNVAHGNAKEGTEEVECEARSGFIPFDSNRGGVQCRIFTDIGNIEGTGCYPGSESATKEIDRQLEIDRDYIRDQVMEEFPALLKRKGITAEQVEYRDLETLAEKDAELKPVFKRYDELEQNQDRSESSIMFEVRFLYHGSTNGIHKASVSAVVNTEGPYHRSHISWLPGLKCEHGEEVELTWKKHSALKGKLARVLKKLGKEIL